MSFSAPSGNEAYLCIESGAFHYHSEYGDNEEELPEDIDSDKYIAIPHKNDLDLGTQLVFRFAREVLPERLSDIDAMFRHRRAYARFKDMLERYGKLQQWYDYEAAAQRQALLEWCEDNGIGIAD